MEILTLLKANIRHKKGSIVSVILLTLIIAMSVTTILSIKESAFKGVDNAHEICDTPDDNRSFVIEPNTISVAPVLRLSCHVIARS